MTADLVTAALSLAEDLAMEAGNPDAPRWIGADVVGDERDARIVDGPIGGGLYDGSAGVALALAAASRAGAAGLVPHVARSAAVDALTTGDFLASTANLDLASGSAGIAYAAAWAGALLRDEEVADGARALALATAHRLPDARLGPDLLIGRAGAVLGVLAVAGDDPEVAAISRAVMRDVAAEGRDESWGRSWSRPDGEEGPGLLGLGHGASGIAVALAEVTARGTPERDGIGAAIEGALAYERSWFDPDRPNWPDLRSAAPTSDGVDPGWSTAWCHGAVGIGIARLRVAEVQSSAMRPALLAEAGAAVQAARHLVVAARGALRAGTVHDCSLCHGLAGVVELLLAAARVTGVGEHLQAARRVARLMLDERRAAGYWPSGLSGIASRRQEPAPEPEPPGLFLGRAGVLLTLLRAADPATAPSCALPEVMTGGRAALRDR
mgnify:CR=1 FL=1